MIYISINIPRIYAYFLINDYCEKLFIKKQVSLSLHLPVSLFKKNPCKSTIITY